MCTIYRSGVEMTTVHGNIGACENDYESVPAMLSVNALPEEKVICMQHKEIAYSLIYIFIPVAICMYLL